jgi:ankyrin repeat protein
MADTPLHRACSDCNSSVEVFRRLIEEHPEALTKKDRHSLTPFHLALYHHRDSPEILQCLLDRCPSRVLGMRDCIGSTPLHLACFWGVSVEIIRQMVRMHSKALRMFDSLERSPLFLACLSDRRSLDLMKLLAWECQALCLILDSNNKSPYDQAAEHQRLAPPPEILSFLAEATKEAAIAFLVCSSQGMITLPAAATAHIQRALLPDFATQGFSMNYMSRNEHIQNIRLLLEDPETLKALLNNSDLQSLLQDEDKQDLVGVMFKLVKSVDKLNLVRTMFHLLNAGSRINDEDVLETKDHVYILESIADTPDCIYLHLRNHPSLCCRSSVNGRAAHRPVATAEKEPPTSAVQGGSTREETSSEAPGRKRKAID